MTAEEIIKSVMAEKKMAREDLCHSQILRHVQARRTTIERMRQAGFSVTEMARAMGRKRDGIKYWLNGEWKATGRWKHIAGRPFPATETNSIVIKVCNDHEIYPAEFFGKGRDKRLTAARRDAMQIMHNLEFSKLAIARLLKLNESSVRYWLEPKTREYARRIARASLARSLERRAA